MYGKNAIQGKTMKKIAVCEKIVGYTFMYQEPNAHVYMVEERKEKGTRIEINGSS